MGFPWAVATDNALKSFMQSQKFKLEPWVLPAFRGTGRILPQMQKSDVGVKKSDDIGMFPTPIEVFNGDCWVHEGHHPVCPSDCLVSGLDGVADAWHSSYSPVAKTGEVVIWKLVYVWV